MFFYRIYQLSILSKIKFDRYTKIMIPIWTKRYLGKFIVYREDYTDVAVDDSAKIKPLPESLEPLEAPRKPEKESKKEKKKKKSKKSSKTPAKKSVKTPEKVKSKTPA